MTNLVYLVSLIATNWATVPGDTMRQGGTNYFRQILVVSTNWYVEEVSACTNRTLYRAGGESRGPMRWTPLAPATMPPPPPIPLPSAVVPLRTKE